MEERQTVNIIARQDVTPRYFVKAERNTKGWSIEASVSNDIDVEYALTSLARMTMALEQTYPHDTVQKGS